MGLLTEAHFLLKEIYPINWHEPILVDDEDYELLSLLKWEVVFNRNKTKVATVRVKQTNIGPVLLNPPSGLWVDHINNNPLDNRRSNLRVCSPQQNSFNRRSVGGTSKYKGVRKMASGKWSARITVDYKRVRLGTFTCEKEAALAYNEAAKEHYGEFAYLNEVEDE